MPHGENWFSLLLRDSPIWDALANLIGIINTLFGAREASTSWYANEAPNPLAFIGCLLVALVITVGGVMSHGATRDTKAAVIPEERLTARTFFELFVGTVYGMMSDIMGPKAARYFLPLIGTCAIFIFTSNALALIPGMTPPTDNMSITFALAAVIFIATHVYGLRENGALHVKHLFGPILPEASKPLTWLAIPLALLMFVIEIISHIARPISLSIRLAANMSADHAVLFAFLSIFPFLVPVPVMVLGTLVVVVQTLVFCILSTVYIGMAIESHDHGHDAH